MKDKLRGAWRSVTIWFNGLLLAALPLFEACRDYLPGLQEYVTPTVYKWVGLSVVLINIGLRFKTSRDLAHK